MLNRWTIMFISGAVLLASACGGARIVKQTQSGGEIALEGERSEAMKQADKEMLAHCQGPYTIVEQGEVVVGTDTVHSDDTYVDEETGTVVNEGGESTRDATEWRIQYVCGSSAPPPGPGAPPPAQGEPPPPPPNY